jgi:glutaredoxin
MKQTIITFTLVLVIVSLLSAIVLGSRDKKNELQNTLPQTQTGDEGSIVNDENGSLIFFYGNTCPHCKDVEEWMDKNRVEEKVKITKKEVYDNRQNSLELSQVAKGCGIPTDNIGVPFLFADGKCLVGTPDIVDYLTKKADIQEATTSDERSEE